jgi:hypothetical protein
VARHPLSDLGSQALSGEFVHALRGQLAVVIGLIDLLLEDADQNAPRRRDLLEAREAAAEAVRLVATRFHTEGPEDPSAFAHS